MATNLPSTPSEDSADKTKLMFNEYGSTQYEFNAMEVDSTLAFFQKRGFKNDAANSVAMVLLVQAKIEKISVMSILDSIKNTDDVQLSIFVSQVLNANRVQTSTLGFRAEVTTTNQTRNIIE